MNQLIIAFAIAIWWPIGLNAATLDYSDALKLVSDAVRGFGTFDNKMDWDRSSLMGETKDSTYDDTVCVNQLQYLLDGLNRTQEYALRCGYWETRFDDKVLIFFIFQFSTLGVVHRLVYCPAIFTVLAVLMNA
jgi:hypothetical protein